MIQLENFNAENMRLVAMDAQYQKLQKEWTTVYKKIMDSAAVGCFSVTFDGYLEKQTKNRLESLGFKVKSNCCRNESYITISWKEREE